MRMRPFVAVLVVVVTLSIALSALGQTPSGLPGAVPRQIPVSGTLLDGAGRSLSGPQLVTFAVYTEADGGAPLWVEVQAVTADERGRFSAWLGATGEGVPATLFQTGEARWLGVQAAGQDEQPRVRLLSVPYAMKAADAETLGGLPVSAFLRADRAGAGVASGRTADERRGFVPLAGTLGQDGTGIPPTAAEGYAGAEWTYLTYIGNGALGANTTGSRNSALGYMALGANTTGSYNTAAGTQALRTATTGGSNTALGYGALYSNTTGGSNTASGYQALYTNTAGARNVALGYRSGYNATTGNDNVYIANEGVAAESGKVRIGTDGTHTDTYLAGTVHGATFTGDGSGLTNVTANQTTGVVAADTTQKSTAVGYQALQANGVTGLYNAAFGYQALTANTTGDYNTATGNLALSSNTTGSGNTASGYKALLANTTGYGNTASGEYALASNTTGYDNSGFGFQALTSVTTGIRNTASGARALFYETTGDHNAAFGGYTLYSVTTGSRNVALGYRAGYNATTGDDNVYIANDGVAAESGKVRIGTYGTHTDTYLAGTVHGSAFTGDGSGLTNVTASQTGGVVAEDTTQKSTAVGYQALLTNGANGLCNAAFGYQALTANTSGGYNTAIGYRALSSNTTGGYNAASGYKALQANTTGSRNLASGHAALYSNTTGSYNTASGYLALYWNTTGEKNHASGYHALYSNTTGARNVALGYQAGYNATSGNDNVYIANVGSADETGAIYLGTEGIHTRTALAGNVGIGTTTPAQKLEVVGKASTYAQLRSTDGNAGLVLTAKDGSAHLWSNYATGAFTVENPLGTPRVTVTADGKFGVGTTTPAQAFELLGVYSQYVNLWSTAGNAGFVLTAGAKQGIVRENVADGSLAIENPNGTERFRVTEGGYVGIGTAAPVHPLQMGSGAHVTLGGVWTNASSRALKDRIAALSPEAALAALLALEPVTYVYKADPTDPQVGFIAEDVPALVATNDRTSLSPMDIVAVAVKVIQAQQARIGAQEVELRTIRQELQELRQLLVLGRQQPR